MEYSLNLHPKQENTYKASERAFVILMVLIWTKSTIMSFIAVYLRSVPILEILADSSITLGIIISAVVALPYFSRRVNVGDIFLFAVMLGVVFSSIWLYKDNAVFIQKDLDRMLWQAFPMYFLGVAYSHDLCKNALLWVSAIGVLTSFAYQMYQLSIGRELSLDNMDASYKVLPSILFLILCVFEYKKLWSIPFIILGGILILSYGTRGPLLIFLVFLGYYAVSYIFRKGSFALKLLAVLIISFAVYCLVVDNVLSDIAENLKAKFEEMGFSTRIFDFFIEDDIVNDSGREDLYEDIIASIKANPIFGNGLMGDRVILGDRYVHHLAYELWCHFGVIFGTIIAVFVIAMPIITIFRCREADIRSLVIMFFCLSIVKLFMSFSYLYEQQLYFLIGLCFALSRQRRSSSYRRDSEKSAEL